MGGNPRKHKEIMGKFDREEKKPAKPLCYRADWLPL